MRPGTASTRVEDSNNKQASMVPGAADLFQERAWKGEA